MSALQFAVREAFTSLRRSGRSAVMSLGTIAIAFLTLGGFVLASANLQSVVQRWVSAAEMSIYLREDLSDADREAMARDVSVHPAVADVEYVSREDALARFKNDFPELADVAVSTENPFPPSLEVRLNADQASASAALELAGQLATRQGVVDVRYDRQWIDRLLAVITSVRLGGLLVASILVLGAAFTVSAVVRLSMQARREEIDIMLLVGAPLGFVRGPAVAEGALLGGIGAVLALVALWGVFAATRVQLSRAVAAWGSIGQLRFLSPSEVTMLVLAGLVVGAISGWLVSRLPR